MTQERLLVGVKILTVDADPPLLCYSKMDNVVPEAASYSSLKRSYLRKPRVVHVHDIPVDKHSNRGESLYVDEPLNVDRNILEPGLPHPQLSTNRLPQAFTGHFSVWCLIKTGIRVLRVAGTHLCTSHHQIGVMMTTQVFPSVVDVEDVNITNLITHRHTHTHTHIGRSQLGQAAQSAEWSGYCVDGCAAHQGDLGA